jgi:hypothetical protein
MISIKPPNLSGMDSGTRKTPFRQSRFENLYRL